METKVVNLRFGEECDIYVGRGSEWGNPFTHSSRKGKASVRVKTRDEAIERYRAHLKQRIRTEPGIVEKLARLHGKRLGCYCAPKRCHADVLKAASLWATLEMMKRELPTNERAMLAAIVSTFKAEAKEITRER